MRTTKKPLNHKITNAIFVLVSLLLLGSVLLGIGRTIFNFTKIITDKNTIIFKSEKKVQEYYFEYRVKLYEYFKDKNPPNIYLVNVDPLTYYYLRYQLYPAKIYRNNGKLFGNPEIPKHFDYYVFEGLGDVIEYKKVKNIQYKLVYEIEYLNKRIVIYKKI